MRTVRSLSMTHELHNLEVQALGVCTTVVEKFNDLQNKRKLAKSSTDVTPTESYFLREIERVIKISNPIKMEPPKILAALARIGRQILKDIAIRWKIKTDSP